MPLSGRCDVSVLPRDHFAEPPDWQTITLLDVVRLAAPTVEDYGASMCTCGAK
jgi:hypothetical protein